MLFRLMTFLVPFLNHLKSSDNSVAIRFSNMATLCLECYSSHPVVVTEGMAFFEVLAKHQDLLPPPSTRVHYTENPMLCCIPFLLANISPYQPEIQPKAFWRDFGGCMSSTIAVRASLRALKLLSLSQILVAEWSDMRIVSTIYAALEATCAGRFYEGETFHRSLAAPRESEIVYFGCNELERELSDVLLLLLFLERAYSKKSTPILLRWILLSRVLLIGPQDDAESEEGEDEVANSVSVMDVRRGALAKAFLDAAPILSCSGTVRWQVKCLATQAAKIAMSEITESCRQDRIKLIDSPDFNPNIAQTICAKKCREATMAGIELPESHLALHLSDIITAACVTSTATVDQSELQILQESAMHLIVELVHVFGPIPDSQQVNQSVLSEFVPQISSCIKAALGASKELHGEVSCRLFFVGCEALRAFIKAQVTNDKMVIKRMVRSALPEPDEAPYFDHSTGPSKEVFAIEQSKRCMNNRANLLLRIGKFWSIGNLLWVDKDLVTQTKAGTLELGVNSAALCIDGVCLLSPAMLSKY